MKTLGLPRNLLSFSALLGLSTALVSAAPQAGSGKVTSVRGTATVNGQAAEAGTPVAAGALLITGAQSELDVNIGLNGPRILLLDSTRLSVDDLTFDTAGAEPVISTKLGLDPERAAEGPPVDDQPGDRALGVLDGDEHRAAHR